MKIIKKLCFQFLADLILISMYYLDDIDQLYDLYSFGLALDLTAEMNDIILTG